MKVFSRLGDTLLSVSIGNTSYCSRIGITLVGGMKSFTEQIMFTEINCENEKNNKCAVLCMEDNNLKYSASTKAIFDITCKAKLTKTNLIFAVFDV